MWSSERASLRRVDRPAAMPCCAFQAVPAGLQVGAVACRSALTARRVQPGGADAEGR